MTGNKTPLHNDVRLSINQSSIIVMKTATDENNMSSGNSKLYSFCYDDMKKVIKQIVFIIMYINIIHMKPVSNHS